MASEFVHTRTIQGIPITIIPPVPKDLAEIGNYGITDPYERIWRPPDAKMVASINKKMMGEIPLNKNEEEFVYQETIRCHEGYWFFNGNELNYVTGDHYHYIAYWYIIGTKTLPDGTVDDDLMLPIYLSADRDSYYHWEEAKKSNKCYGVIELSFRRRGKSYRLSQLAYKSVAFNKNTVALIQSKTKDDGLILFEKVVAGWRNMFKPFFPIHTGQNPPKDKLVFDYPQKRGKASDEDIPDTMNSRVMLRSSKGSSGQGARVKFWGLDEAAVSDREDCGATWNRVKPALKSGAHVIGKGRVTSTAEDMSSKGGAAYKKLWDKSHQMLPNGQTVSGLWPYFNGADDGFLGDVDEGHESFVDHWGNSRKAEARKYWTKHFASLPMDERINEMRIFPIEIAHAFYTKRKSDEIPDFLINQQLRFIDEVSFKPEQGNFYWKEYDKEVGWHPDPNGRWFATWLPPVEMRNKFIQKGLIKMPTRKEMVFSADPINTGVYIADLERGSLFASHGMRRHSFSAAEPGKTVVIEYLNRCEPPEVCYEDMIMQCVFCSAMILPEKNLNQLIMHMRARGYEGYIMDPPEHLITDYAKTHQKDPGLSTSSPHVRSRLIEGYKSYIYENVGYDEIESCYKTKLMFKRTLEDALEFDPQDWTPNDLTVSMMLLVAADIGMPKNNDRVLKAAQVIPIPGQYQKAKKLW